MKKETAPLTVPPNAMARMQEKYREQAGELTTGESVNEVLNEVLKLPTQETVDEPMIETTLEGWIESILERSKVPMKDGTTSRLNIEIDEDLHFALKRYCVGKRVTVRRLLIELIGAYLRDAKE